MVLHSMAKCSFCTRPADSREHIFSDWMIELIPRGKSFVCNERILSRDEYIRYPKKRIRIVAKVVCSPCNNGWMSDLEGELKPILKDALFTETPRIFSTKELSTIAAFAFKTLVIANHKDLKRTPFFPSAERVSFRRNRLIPNGVQVWMATRKSIPGKYYGCWKSLSGTSNEPSRYGFSNYMCTWNFQNIVLQVLAMKWKDKRRRKTVPVLPIIQNEYWDDAAIPIWPLSGRELQWPPLAYLGEDTFISFRDRLTEYSITFT
jgi:hypothetical protein